jgi:hypothetical protein
VRVLTTSLKFNLFWVQILILGSIPKGVRSIDGVVSSFFSNNQTADIENFVFSAAGSVRLLRRS